MGAEADDDALSWGHESDPTHVDFAQTDAVAGSDGPVSASGTSSAMLVVFGVFGGIYFLYTVAWLITALQPGITTGNTLNDFMTQGSRVLAVLAAPAWFITALALTASRRSGVRILFLVLGIVVLLPWGFVSGRIW
ncbi:MAG: hypothetical protein ABI053_04270 [Lacisediminihabitans sp.]